MPDAKTKIAPIDAPKKKPAGVVISTWVDADVGACIAEDAAAMPRGTTSWVAAQILRTYYAGRIAAKNRKTQRKAA